MESSQHNRDDSNFPTLAEAQKKKLTKTQLRNLHVKQPETADENAAYTAGSLSATETPAPPATAPQLPPSPVEFTENEAKPPSPPATSRETSAGKESVPEVTSPPATTATETATSNSLCDEYAGNESVPEATSSSSDSSTAGLLVPEIAATTGKSVMVEPETRAPPATSETSSTDVPKAPQPLPLQESRQNLSPTTESNSSEHGNKNSPWNNRYDSSFPPLADAQKNKLTKSQLRNLHVKQTETAYSISLSVESAADRADVPPSPAGLMREPETVSPAVTTPSTETTSGKETVKVEPENTSSSATSAAPQSPERIPFPELLFGPGGSQPSYLNTFPENEEMEIQEENSETRPFLGSERMYHGAGLPTLLPEQRMEMTENNRPLPLEAMSKRVKKRQESVMIPHFPPQDAD